MTVFRYKGDSRSIPTQGGSEGLVGVGPQTLFSVKEGQLVVREAEGENGTVPIGTQMQYRVQISSQPATN